MIRVAVGSWRIKEGWLMDALYTQDVTRTVPLGHHRPGGGNFSSLQGER